MKPTNEIRSTPAILEQNEDAVWLTQRDNFSHPNYNNIYEKQYQKYLESKEDEALGEILVYKGIQLDYLLEYDSIYVKRNKAVLHEKNLSENVSKNLYYYLGVQYDFIEKADSSKYYVKKVFDYNPTAMDKITSYSRLSGLFLSTHPDSSQYYILKALKLCDDDTPPAYKATLYFRWYVANIHVKDLEAEKLAFDKTIEYAKIAKDTSRIIDINQIHAQTLLLDRNDPNYISYAVEADRYLYESSKEHTYYLFYSLFFRVMSLLDKGKLVEAEESIRLASTLMLDDDATQEHLLEMMKLRYEYTTSESFDMQILDDLIKVYSDQKYYNKLPSLLNEGIKYCIDNEDYEKACEYMKLENQYQDLIWTENKSGIVVKYDRQFEAIKKEQKIEKQERVIYKRTVLIGALCGVILFVILSSLYFINIRRRKYAESKQLIQEKYANSLLNEIDDERGRIAGDLHDSVNHNLLNLKHKLQKEEHLNESDIESVIQQIREISHNLYPAMFEEVGLVRSIEELCRTTMEYSELMIATQIEYTASLKTNHEMQVYRIVEEALNNILKHSKATHAFVKISNDEEILKVSVKDNGIGIPENITSGENLSFGVANMQQRAKSINGKLSLTSNDKGTQLNLIVNL